MTSRLTARLRSSLTTLSLVAATIALAGCGADQQEDGASGPAALIQATNDGFAGTLVEDPPLRPASVVLRDTYDKPYRLGQPSRGKVTAVFFGFTNCDDVCPTTMADLASARRTLPSALAHRVEVVFVTVDPRRDTPRVLQEWLDRFDPDFVGLRGPMSLVHRAERSLYAAQSAIEPPTDGHHATPGNGSSDGNGDYEVSHSGSVYVFGPGGETLLYSGGTAATQYARDFARLLDQTGPKRGFPTP